MIKRLAQLLLGISVAAFFIWLSLREVHVGEVAETLRSIGFLWILPYAVVVALSALVRAERWKLLLDDETGGVTPRRPLLNGVFYGYSANFVLPRAGEFVRALYVGRQTGIESTRLFGTIVLERIIDVFMMLLMLLVTFLLLVTDVDMITMIFGEEGAAYVYWFTTPPGLLVIGLLLISGLGILWYLRKRYLAGVSSDPGNWGAGLSRPETANHPEVSTPRDSDAGPDIDQSDPKNGVAPNSNRIVLLGKNFLRGVFSLRKLKNWPMFLVYTLLIWFGYVVMTLIPFYAFDLMEAGFGWEHAFVITVVGAVGIMLPSPGGVGSFHYLVQQGMVVLYGLTPVIALSYATISHFVNICVILAITAVLYFRR